MCVYIYDRRGERNIKTKKKISKTNNKQMEAENKEKKMINYYILFMSVKTGSVKQ